MQRASPSSQIRPTVLFSALSLIATMPGCATLRGSQDTFISAPATTAIDLRLALEMYYKPNDADRLGMTRRDYRDYVAGSVQSGVENRYKKFVDQLQSSNRGSALGLNLLVLGLSGATALAGKSAIDELATITTVASGARATVDKDLFFERTLPAVIALMDAERAEIKTGIAKNRAQPAERYSLGDALDDLHRLEQAGSIERAFARMTKSAVDDKAAEEERLNTIVAACDELTPTSGAQARELRVFLTKDPAKSASRRALAGEVLDVKGKDAAPPSWLALAGSLEVNYCDDSARRTIIDTIIAKVNASEGS